MAKRTYEGTHPWIKFDLDVASFDLHIWTMLGEASSKTAHIAGVPLAPEVADKFLLLFMAKGAQATTAIEGNTLTEEQVKEQVAGRLKLPSSQQYLQIEVQNIIDAFCRILDDLAQTVRPITPQFLLDLNEEVLRGMELEEGIVAGEIRRHNVTVGTYRGAPPEDCYYLLSEMCRFLNEPIEGVSKEIAAILKALFAHIYIALIHPFGDGNGRTARLVEFYLLMQAGLPQPTGHLLSNHYNKTRSSYYSELDRISKSGGVCRHFVKYALQGFVDGLGEQIDSIKDLQMQVAWQNYVHEAFRHQKSTADVRRRELVLELGRHGMPVSVQGIRELTPRLAREYAYRTDKTINRDINALVEMKLLMRTENKQILANRDAIRAFLPWRSKGLRSLPRKG